jgi:apolipoprotein N-acyltransferase
MAISDRPVSAVLTDIVQHLQAIVNAEFRLARTEVRQELAAARTASLLVGAAALGGLLAVFFLLLAAVYALAIVIPAWAAALCVAFAVSVAVALTMAAGLKRFKTVRGAPETVSTVQENVEWAKQQMR